MSARHCWRCAAVLDAAPPTVCASCGEAHYANPKPCGDALVVHAGRLLMLLRARDPDAGAWTVPGGFCEAAEHPRDAAERELHEETGLRGRAVAHLGTWMDTYGPPAFDGLQIHTAVTGYLCELDDPSAEPSPQPGEALEVAWFSLDALPEPIAFGAHVPAMIAAAESVVARGVGGPAGWPPMFDRVG